MFSAFVCFVSPDSAAKRPACFSSARTRLFGALIPKTVWKTRESRGRVGTCSFLLFWRRFPGFGGEAAGMFLSCSHPIVCSPKSNDCYGKKRHESRGDIFCIFHRFSGFSGEAAGMFLICSHPIVWNSKSKYLSQNVLITEGDLFLSSSLSVVLSGFGGEAAVMFLICSHPMIWYHKAKYFVEKL